jgi:hypothetical protein
MVLKAGDTSKRWAVKHHSQSIFFFVFFNNLGPKLAQTVHAVLVKGQWQSLSPKIMSACLLPSATPDGQWLLVYFSAISSIS